MVAITRPIVSAKNAGALIAALPAAVKLDAVSGFDLAKSMLAAKSSDTALKGKVMGAAMLSMKSAVKQNMAAVDSFLKQALKDSGNDPALLGQVVEGARSVLPAIATANPNMAKALVLTMLEATANVAELKAKVIMTGLEIIPALRANEHNYDLGTFVTSLYSACGNEKKLQVAFIENIMAQLPAMAGTYEDVTTPSGGKRSLYVSDASTIARWICLNVVIGSSVYTGKKIVSDKVIAEKVIAGGLAVLFDVAKKDGGAANQLLDTLVYTAEDAAARNMILAAGLDAVALMPKKDRGSVNLILKLISKRVGYIAEGSHVGGRSAADVPFVAAMRGRIAQQQQAIGAQAG